MKIVTVLGTRPEIIRLSEILPKIDRHADHVVVHTGQNNSQTLSDVFFSELNLRPPDHHLGVQAEDFARQIGKIMVGCHDVFVAEKPDRLLVLGDTNSAFCAVVAKRLGIPVFHMEAGNRSYDPRIPEEVNRRIVDHVTDIFLPYTERSRQNLLREGIASDRIFVTGNPIHEVMAANMDAIDRSSILGDLGLAPDGYLLVTLHRAENVDIPERLAVFLEAFDLLAERHGCPVIVSTHPRTRHRLSGQEAGRDARVRYLDPFGFLDFVKLEKNARCLLSDSGTVQEEGAILGVPTVTLRDVTERPETLECGANLLTGCDAGAIAAAVTRAMECRGRWRAPPEYLATGVSDTVVNLMMSYHHGLGR